MKNTKPNLETQAGQSLAEPGWLAEFMGAFSAVKVRDSHGVTAWEIGDMTVATQRGRVHLIRGMKLNVSVPIRSVRFHAGKSHDLAHALMALADKHPTVQLADGATLAAA